MSKITALDPIKSAPVPANFDSLSPEIVTDVLGIMAVLSALGPLFKVSARKNILKVWGTRHAQQLLTVLTDAEKKEILCSHFSHNVELKTLPVDTLIDAFMLIQDGKLRSEGLSTFVKPLVDANRTEDAKKVVQAIPDPVIRAEAESWTRSALGNLAEGFSSWWSGK